MHVHAVRPGHAYGEELFVNRSICILLRAPSSNQFGSKFKVSLSLLVQRATTTTAGVLTPSFYSIQPVTVGVADERPPTDRDYRPDAAAHASVRARQQHHYIIIRAAQPAHLGGRGPEDGARPRLVPGAGAQAAIPGLSLIHI